MLFLINNSFKRKASVWQMIIYNYDLKVVLGEGRFGYIFEEEVTNQEDDKQRQMDVKRIKSKLSEEKNHLELLQMTLNHPNVIRLVSESLHFM